MTPLPSDSLVFKLVGDEMIPCTGQAVSFALAGDGASVVSEHVFQEAAAAVLHYFRQELGRTRVSVGEFSAALEVVLHSLGLTQIKAAPAPGGRDAQTEATDLGALVEDGMELLFFQRLREEMRRQLRPSPQMVRFQGLRSSVLRLTGTRRWSPRCQVLHDQIVDFLRNSFLAEPRDRPCGLVIQ
jgi:hypothetical protein